MIKGQLMHGFEILDISEIPEMKGTGVFARHIATGLEVFHIVTDDEENLFAYAFMTPPEDSTGVAHILEHSVLCGSEQYPLKDPFLVLAKQSVKTFLNAMTFPDKTVYPASSMVRKDYFNLMSVYGDAVFFPLLDEKVFRQEGHRFEFAEDGAVSIQGVVFNEMRGNYSSFDSVAGDWSVRSLLSGTPYEHDSGGDPADIPALTYEQFCAFHKKYYHPVNCRVFLSGNISTEEQLAFLQDRFLNRFAPAQKPELIAPVPEFDSPRELEVPAPAGAEQDKNKVTFMLNWLLPDATDVVSLMEANLVSEILLGHDGAPLSRAIMESGLGEDLAPSTGLETEMRHLCFTIGLRGADRSVKEDFEALVFKTIRGLAESGIDPEEVETAVRSIDFSNREIRRSGGPFALTLMRRSLRGWIHGLSPMATLRYVPAFEEIKRRLSGNPSYIQDLLRSWFLQNPHRSFVTVYPDSQYEKRLEESLASRVRLFESTLTPEKKERLGIAQKEFFAWQKETDSPENLARIPHLETEDLPALADRIPTIVDQAGEVPLLCHEQPTNGIAYVDIALPVDALEPEDYPYLPLFTSALTGMALPGLGWVETSALSARLTGGLGAMLFASSSIPGSAPTPGLDPNACGRDLMVVRVKMLAELAEDALPLAIRFLRDADFSDAKRLGDLLLEYRNDLDSSLAPAGHQYASSRAASYFSRTKAVDEIWNGFAQIRFVREISAGAGDSKAMNRLAARFDDMRSRLLGAGMIVNATGTEEILAQVKTILAKELAGFASPTPPSGKDRFAEFLDLANPDASRIGAPSVELFSSSLQVGFASAVIPALPFGDPGQPVEIVLGHWLASGPLWEKIRTTGGAYGTFAYPDYVERVFAFSSYRDPQPLRSVEVFREALEQAASERVDALELAKTITGCYSREVQPRSPSDKGFTAFIRSLYGITDEVRKAKIEGILRVTPESLSFAASRLLDCWSSARVVALAGKKALPRDSVSEFYGNVRVYTI